MGRARGKLTLQKISNDRSRRLTFAKRKNGLKKKMFEFSTLCDVEACMVCYGSDGELETWPEDKSQVLARVEKFNSIDRDERDRRKLDISSFFQAKKKKLEEEIESARRNNSEFCYLTWDNRLDKYVEEQLKNLVNFLDNKMEKIRARADLLKMNQSIKGNEVDFSMVSDNNQNQIYGQSLLLPAPTSDFITSNPSFFDAPIRQMVKIRPSNYYGDVGSSLGCQWGSSRKQICNYGYGLIDMGNLPFVAQSMIHHQPPPLAAMLPPPPLSMQRPPIAIRPSMPQHGFQHLLGGMYPGDLDLQFNGGMH